jgi:hypothetical protein
VETGVVLITVANEAGVYRFLFLNPGQYKLVATMTGFKTFERSGIRVNVSEAGTVPDGARDRGAERADYRLVGSTAD